MRSAIIHKRYHSPALESTASSRCCQLVAALTIVAALFCLPGCSRRVQGTPAQSTSAPPGISSAARTPLQAAPQARTIRTTGLIRALESQSTRVPQLSGTGIRLTVTRIVPNGSKVAKDDILAEFDPTSLLDAERDAKAKLDDLAHQLDQKKAQVSSDDAGRVSQIRSAEADLEKAQLQLRKGPILSEIDRLKNEARASNAKLRLASLNKSDELHKRAEAAMVRIQELKLQRQKVALERTQSNLQKMQVRAPHDGMVALENIWRSGSMGPARAGDDLYPGMPLLRIFNPLRMVAEAIINESDVAWLSRASHARLYLDAYPGAIFDADLEYASPVATSGFDSPVRAFAAIFGIRQQDPRLLPDLSAALEIDASPAVAEAAPAGAGKPKGQP